MYTFFRVSPHHDFLVFHFVFRLLFSLSLSSFSSSFSSPLLFSSLFFASLFLLSSFSFFLFSLFSFFFFSFSFFVFFFPFSSYFSFIYKHTRITVIMGAWHFGLVDSRRINARKRTSPAKPSAHMRCRCQRRPLSPPLLSLLKV